MSDRAVEIGVRAVVVVGAIIVAALIVMAHLSSRSSTDEPPPLPQTVVSAPGSGEPGAPILGDPTTGERSLLGFASICGCTVTCPEDGTATAMYVRCASMEPGARGRTALYRMHDGALCAFGSAQPVANGWNRWELTGCRPLEAGRRYLLAFQHNAAGDVAYGTRTSGEIFAEVGMANFAQALPDPIELEPIRAGDCGLSICCTYVPGTHARRGNGAPVPGSAQHCSRGTTSEPHARRGPALQ